tara:strand:- start:545 stop:1060 length:516 start_codon:yes stop_codon:yes gene_type:complete
METKSHILAIVQVFEDHIDLDSDALMKEVDQSYLRKDDNADNTFFEDFKYPDTPMLQDLKQTIQTKVEAMLSQKLQYEDIWVHKTPPRAQTGLHNHGAAFCSFVYYPNFIEKQGSLRFILFWNGKIVEKVITPKEKMLLVFPGEVFHFTSQNDTETERVSISGNFLQKKEH